MIEYDYRYKFPLSGLALAITGFAALQAAGLLSPGTIPPNMLGSDRDASGNVVAPGDSTVVAWRGDAGIAQMVDPSSGGTIEARGDPAFYYVAIRSEVAPADVTVNPADYGLVTCDPIESAAVLGGWE